MDARAVTQVERNVQRAASAIFAGACAFALYALLPPIAREPLRAVASAIAFLVAYGTCCRALGAVDAKPPAFAQQSFEVAPVMTSGPDELVLTDDDRIGIVADAPDDKALVLDDVLAELGPDSRVVRLFDPAAMPTAGELKDRIDRHLHRGNGNIRLPDASQALHDALAELRHELR
jgi:hypothetical protein